MLPIEDATLLELKLKWLHVRILHAVFTNEMQYFLESYNNHHNCYHCFHGCWVAASIKLCFGIDGLGIPSYVAALADAG